VTTSSNPATLRPEAQPVAYKGLDPRQQKAFARVVELFDAAVADVDSTGDAPAKRIGPFLDQHRSSRTVLVSGERGTGKTTLLLSLVQALRDLPLVGPAADALPAPIHDRLSRLRRRLVWLETLDLEPLPGSANLLGGVLARVEAAVSELGVAVPSEPVPGLLSPGQKYHEAVDELRRLQTTVALAFEGNLASRAGSLDPDTFAVEVRRTERERVGLTQRFSDVLAGLSAAIGGSTEFESPLFVLAVDDLDLNPPDCVPLLELLRAAHSPHLVVVMIADLDLLQLIMRLKYRSDLAELARPADLDPDDRSRSDALAENALRKHLPPHQRVTLSRVDPAHALEFRPFGSTGPVLGELIGEVVLAPDRLSVSTDSPVLPGPSLRVPHGDAGGWREILRVTFRELLDFYYIASASHAAENPPGEAIRSFTQARLDEFSRAGARGRYRSRDSAIVNAGLSWLTVEEREDYRIRTATIVRWQVDLASESALGSNDMAAVLGAVDILGDEYWARDVNVSPLRRTERITYSMDRAPAPRFASSSQDIAGVDWPMIQHATVWGYERARRILNSADRQWEKEPERWHGAWVAAMTLLVEEAITKREVTSRFGRVARNWDELIDRIRSLPRSPFVDTWLIGVGWLCTPEMGMREPWAEVLVPPDLLNAVGAERESRLSILR
jgi:hypothetical protein